MLKDPQIGTKIQASVVRGNGTCAVGHQAGDQFSISCYCSSGLCGFFYHHIFPDLQTFQMGGRMPWWDEDALLVQCPDPENTVTLRLEKVR